MRYLVKTHGSPFWQVRFPYKSGFELQRPTKTRDKKQAEGILAGWALQAHLERQPGLCKARVRLVSYEMSRLVGGDTSPMNVSHRGTSGALAIPELDDGVISDVARSELLWRRHWPTAVFEGIRARWGRLGSRKTRLRAAAR